MKRLLLALTCLIALSGADLSAAGLGGKIVFVTKRGQHPAPNETLVWLEPAANAHLAKRPPVHVQLVTRSKTLVPHVLAIPTGSTVDFPNDDPISHNLFSLSKPNDFDLGLYRRGAGKSQKFESPGLVNVYCNVHPNMSAVIQVMSSPYYAFADGGGNYSIADVVPGRYRLVAWNELGGITESAIEVDAAGKVTGNLSLTLDSRSYRDTQHLNKAGKPYQAPMSVGDY